MTALDQLTPLLLSAAQLLLVGMSFVFVFLAILIGAVHLLSKFAARFSPEPVGSAEIAVPSKHGEPNPSVIAAISAAVVQYRNKNRN